MGVGPIAILDISSRYLRIVIAEKKNNSEVKVYFSNAAECYSIYDGEFIISSDELRGNLLRLIEDAEKASGYLVKKIYVGLPSDFLKVDIKNVHIDLNVKKKITAENIDELFKKAEAGLTDQNFKHIKTSAVYYVSDDNKRIMAPAGLSSSKLSALLSCISVKNRVYGQLDEIFAHKGIVAEYISSGWAVMMYLFEPGQRDRYVLLADIGFLSTSVTLMRGDGILSLAVFPIGGANIADDFIRYFNIDIQTALNIKKECDLSGVNKSLNYKAGLRAAFPVITSENVRDIAKGRLIEIARNIRNITISGSYDCPPHIPLYFFGDGVGDIKGAGDIIGRVMQRSSTAVDRGNMSAKLPLEIRGIIEYIFTQDSVNKKGFFDIFKK